MIVRIADRQSMQYTRGMDNTFIFAGRPGAGKGTQAKLLAEKMNAQFISAGAELRKFAELDTPISVKVKEEIEQGVLLPHWVPIYLFHQIVFGLKGDEPIVLDGFARRPLEARTITNTFNWIDRPFTVIYLDIPEEVVRERIEIRKKTQNRADDDADDSVEMRIKEFNEHTLEAVEYFKDHAHVVEIDGTKSIEEIQEEIWQSIQ